MTRYCYAICIALFLAACMIFANGCIMVTCSGGTPCYVSVDKPVDISGAVQGNVPVNGGTVTSPENKYGTDVVPTPELPTGSVFPIYRGVPKFSEYSTYPRNSRRNFRWSSELN